MTDYKKNNCSKRMIATFLAEGFLLISLLSYLFYRSWIAMLFCSPLLYFYVQQKIKDQQKQRRNQLNLQFKDGILSVSAALKVGYSVENSFAQAHKDLLLLYQEKDDITLEFQHINRQLKNNVILEKILLDFARRSGVKDIKDFAEIFIIAKRSGGDLTKIIQNAVEVISEKIEVQREIQIILSAKKFEQKIMNLVPIGIIVYISISSPGFFQVLYHNLRGIMIMSGCLFVYLVAYLLAKRITDIEV